MPDESSSSWAVFLRQLPARVLAHWRLKAVLAALIGASYTALYLLIGHNPIAPVRQLPLTWLDRVIGFYPYEWVWIYQSLYLPVNLIPWIADRRADLRRVVAGFGLISVVSVAIFLAWPIQAPKPPVDDATGMYWLLLQYDAPNNSFPSLHAGMLVYALAFGYRVVGRRTPRGLKLLLLAWAGLILYGTLATKEHYAVDIVAGVALGLLGHWLIWRNVAAGGVLEETPQQGPEVAAGGEVVVGVGHGINVSRQAEHVR